MIGLMEINDMTPPFDPEYAGIGTFDVDRAWSEDSSDALRDIPERFVYDAPVDEWGLAEMSIPERNEFLDDFADAAQAQWEIEQDLRATRYFEESGVYSGTDPYDY